MDRIGLAVFALHHAAAFGLWRAGADMYGGTLRRHRADLHRNLAAQALHALLGRPPERARAHDAAAFAEAIARNRPHRFGAAMRDGE